MITQKTLIRLATYMPEVQARDRYSVVRIKFEITQTSPAYIDGVRVGPEDQLPLELFLYRREPLNVFDKTERDTCLGVCALDDIGTYPTGAPNSSSTYPFFRKNYAIFDALTNEQAIQIATSIRDQLSLLGHILDSNLELSLMQDSWLPEAPVTIYVGDLRIGAGVTVDGDAIISEPSITTIYTMTDVGIDTDDSDQVSSDLEVALES